MSIEQLFSIPEEEIISLIKEDIKNKETSPMHNYVLYDYKFYNIFTNAYINKTNRNNKDIFSLKVSLSDSYKELFNKNFDNVEDIIKFLLNNFRKEYKYSNITDCIESKKDIEKSEKIFISKKYCAIM